MLFLAFQFSFPFYNLHDLPKIPPFRLSFFFDKIFIACKRIQRYVRNVISVDKSTDNGKKAMHWSAETRIL